ncbi:hypothetical protein ACHAPX_000409 [Trichoderma viride]
MPGERMAVIALVTSGDRRIYALPGQPADVETVYGGGYEDEDEEPELSAAMKLPVEVVQKIYQHLSPMDFDSARHTCRV